MQLDEYKWRMKEMKESFLEIGPAKYEKILREKMGKGLAGRERERKRRRKSDGNDTESGLESRRYVCQSQSLWYNGRGREDTCHADYNDLDD